jgi:hypothetical protein
MFYIVLYLAAIIAANLSVAHFGPSSSIINAFLFIGLDLTSRDHLHDAWRNDKLWRKMALLIGTGSALSWTLNRNAGQIALASFVAFALAGVGDALLYHRLRNLSRFKRINGSNLLSAAVDSLTFPILAFGWPPMWNICAGQFIAKVGGGLLWSLVLRRATNKGVSENGTLSSCY